jgi:hypothetical protein
MQFATYFGENICSQKPYAIPWNNIYLRIMHEGVSSSQILYALNGTIVGLSIINTQHIKFKSKQEVTKIKRTH